MHFHYEDPCGQWDKGAIILFTGPKRLAEEGNYSVKGEWEEERDCGVKGHYTVAAAGSAVEVSSVAGTGAGSGVPRNLVKALAQAFLASVSMVS